MGENTTSSAATAEALLTFECMVFDNPLRQSLASPLLSDGMLDMRDAPRLGVTLHPGAVARLTIKE